MIRYGRAFIRAPLYWVLGRTLPDLKLSLLLKRHNCIELSYLDPRIVRQVRPLPGVSRTCAVMINSLENPVHMNLLEELRKQQVRLRLKRARPAAKLPPPLLECRSGQPFEELRKRLVRQLRQVNCFEDIMRLAHGHTQTG